MKTHSTHKPCRDRRDAMLDALEGRLDGDRRSRFEAHLSTCGACSESYEELRRTLGRLETVAAKNEEPRDLTDLRRNVRRAVFDEAERSGSRRWLPVMGTVAAVAALLLAVFWWGGMPSNENEKNRMLAQVEEAGQQSLMAGQNSPPILLDEVLAEDYPLDEDLDQMIDEMTTAELEALSRRLAALTGEADHRG